MTRPVVNLKIAVSVPEDAPACFEFKPTFASTTAEQIQQLLEDTWPMMVWAVTPEEET